MKYVTIVGCSNFFGTDVFKVGQIIYGVKEPDNCFDAEAIQVVSDANVPYGYIANSVHTVAKGCMSAGRIYDCFNDKIKLKILFIIRGSVIAEIIQ